MGKPSEIVLVNGRFRTLDRARPLAEAVAVSDGTIVAVGTRAECLDALPNATKIDLQGGWGFPGMNDAHAHLLGLGMYLTDVDLVGSQSEDELVSRVALHITGKPPTDWVRGFGWNQSIWIRTTFPTHHLLTRLAPDRPVWLTRIDGHAGLANEMALRLAGIDRDTPDPPGGRIVRDGDGNPTGVLIDTAMHAVQKQIPQMTEQVQEDLLLRALHSCAAFGLTAVTDAGMDGPTLSLVMRLDREGRLPIHVYAMIDGTQPGLLDHWLERGPWFGARLTIRCVKLFLDGALGSRGAAFFEDYSDDPGNRGLSLLPYPQYRELLRRAHDRGFQVAIHSIGDKANAEALDGIAAENIPASARPRLEHAQILRPSDIPRLAPLGVIASMQPSHCLGDMPFVETRIGCARLGGAFAWRSLAATGATLAFGSDFPIESPDPRRGLHAALTRQQPDDPSQCFVPSETIDIETALDGFTSGAAWAAFAEDRMGRIAPGFQADITVFDRDLVDAQPGGILAARVLGTLVGGQFAFDARVPGAGGGEEAAPSMATTRSAVEATLVDVAE